MDDPTFYRISCACSSSRGRSFCLEFVQNQDQPIFVMRRQNDAPLLHMQQKIDLSLPYSEQELPYKTVVAILKQLETQTIPVLPAMTGGFDGMYYYLKISNISSHIEYSWWLDAPEGWQPIEQVWRQLVALSENP